MPTLKTAKTGEQFQREARDYFINMLCGARKLHKKGVCQYSKTCYEYYDFDTKEEAYASGIEFTTCGLCFKK